MSYATEVLADSPVAYWHLSDLTDAGPSGLTLTSAGTVTAVNSLVPTDSGASKAKQLQTNTGQDMLTTPDTAVLRLHAAFTIEAWLQVGFVPAEYNAIQKSLHYFLRTNSTSRFQCELRGSWGFLSATATAAAVANTPYHVVAVFNNTDLRLYVNGALVATTAVTGTPNATASRFCIGADVGVQNGFWGIVDEVAIYNTALSPTRVAAHYTAGTTTYEDLAVVFSGASTMPVALTAMKALATDLSGDAGLAGSLSAVRGLLTAFDASSDLQVQMPRIVGLEASLAGESGLATSLETRSVFIDLAAELAAEGDLTAVLGTAGAFVDLQASLAAQGTLSSSLDADVEVVDDGTIVADWIEGEDERYAEYHRQRAARARYQAELEVDLMADSEEPFLESMRHFRALVRDAQQREQAPEEEIPDNLVVVNQSVD